MKIQIDYDNKTISLEDNVDLGLFVKRIKEILPEWKEWSLKTNTVIENWTPPFQVYPLYPWWNQPYGTQPNFIDCTSPTVMQFNGNDTLTGVVNLDLTN